MPQHNESHINYFGQKKLDIENFIYIPVEQ